MRLTVYHLCFKVPDPDRNLMLCKLAKPRAIGQIETDDTSITVRYPMSSKGQGDAADLLTVAKGTGKVWAEHWEAEGAWL
jgi:hypothetical protein